MSKIEDPIDGTPANENKKTDLIATPANAASPPSTVTTLPAALTTSQNTATTASAATSTSASAGTGSKPATGKAGTDQALPKKPRRRWLLAAMVLALFVLAGGAYYFRSTYLAAEEERNNVLTAIVQKGDIEDLITATGSLQPKDYVDVGTQVSGQLKRLLVDVGAVVKAKDLLAEIDPTVYQSKADADRAQLRNQTAQLSDKQAQLVLAELQLKRQQNLMQEEATTGENLQTAQATQKSALAQVASLKAQMQQTESTLRGDDANLSYTKIYAPIAGTVVSQTARQGQTLNANQQAPIVMRIADLSYMTVEAQVSEADISKLHLGMDVYFTTLGGSTRRYYGKLRQIPPTPVVLNNVVLYDALFDVPNPRQTLMPQMTAQVFFVLASARDAINIPLTALHAPVSKTDKTKQPGANPGHHNAAQDVRGQFKDGKAAVSVMDANGKITEREVQVGVMTRVSAQILSGLAPGEKVVVGNKANASAPATAPGQQGGSALTGNQRGGPR
jgi:macrolide-specific efflux system membrane fusion protein